MTRGYERIIGVSGKRKCSWIGRADTQTILFFQVN